MRQAGAIAAAGIIALEEMTERLKEDHENAKILSSELEKISIFEVLSKKSYVVHNCLTYY